MVITRCSCMPLQSCKCWAHSQTFQCKIFQHFAPHQTLHLTESGEKKKSEEFSAVPSGESTWICSLQVPWNRTLELSAGICRISTEEHRQRRSGLQCSSQIHRELCASMLSIQWFIPLGDKYWSVQYSEQVVPPFSTRLTPWPSPRLRLKWPVPITPWHCQCHCIHMGLFLPAEYMATPLCSPVSNTVSKLCHCLFLRAWCAVRSKQRTTLAMLHSWILPEHRCCPSTGYLGSYSYTTILEPRILPQEFFWFHTRRTWWTVTWSALGMGDITSKNPLFAMLLAIHSTSTNCWSVAESSCFSHSSFHWKKGDMSLINVKQISNLLTWPPGIPLELNLVSFSKPNLCPSDHFRIMQYLVHLLVLSESFLHFVETKAPALTCRWQPVSVCIGNSTTNNRVFNYDVTGSQYNSHLTCKGCIIWNHQPFQWKNPGLSNSSVRVQVHSVLNSRKRTVVQSWFQPWVVAL